MNGIKIPSPLDFIIGAGLALKSVVTGKNPLYETRPTPPGAQELISKTLKLVEAQTPVSHRTVEKIVSSANYRDKAQVETLRDALAGANNLVEDPHDLIRLNTWLVTIR